MNCLFVAILEVYQLFQLMIKHILKSTQYFASIVGNGMSEDVIQLKIMLFIKLPYSVGMGDSSFWRI